MKGHLLLILVALLGINVAVAWAEQGAISPKLSFEQTVYDLGQVGLGTKNMCEFKFTNTGQTPLIITDVRSTCGCTVFKLDKREYTPNESGTIRPTYSAPRTPTITAKHIYVSSNLVIRY